MGAIVELQQMAELGSFSHMALALELRKEERNKTTVVKHVPGMSLNAGPIERPLCKAVNSRSLKNPKCWRC